MCCPQTQTPGLQALGAQLPASHLHWLSLLSVPASPLRLCHSHFPTGKKRVSSCKPASLAL